MIIESVTELIGNTPLLRIPPELTGLKRINLYAKLELMNPFGSVKDRIAWAMLKPHLDEIKEGKKTVYENSSGNTAKALQAICGIYGIPFKLISALVRVPEAKEILKLLGAEIEEIPSASDCFDPNDPNDPQFMIDRLVEANPERVFFTSQFTNYLNPTEHYHSTGSEILKDLERVDYLIGGLGTSGSTQGVARKIREKFSDLKVFGITAEKYDFIPGIRTVDEMWETGIYRQDTYNEIKSVSSAEAIEGMLALNRKCGVLCGPTSGANFAGAINFLKRQDAAPLDEQPKNAVFIVCDRVEWYTSYIRKRRPDLFGEINRATTTVHDLLPEEIEEAPGILVDQLCGWISRHSALVVDVRNHLSYSLGSIPGAVNIPLEQLEPLIENGAAFEKERPLILACQIGLKTKPLSALLCRKGYRGYHLMGGVRAWNEFNNSNQIASTAKVTDSEKFAGVS
jgi:cysteine synthase B